MDKTASVVSGGVQAGMTSDANEDSNLTNVPANNGVQSSSAVSPSSDGNSETLTFQAEDNFVENDPEEPEQVFHAFVPENRPNRNAPPQGATQNAPLVEGVAFSTDQEGGASKSKVLRFTLSVAFLCAVVAAAVAIPTIIINKNRQEKDGSIDVDDFSSMPSTSFPSDTPTIVISVAPSTAPSISPTMAPTTAAPTTQKFTSIVSMIFGSDAGDVPTSPSSPQWKALYWLAEVDGSNVTTSDDPDSSRIIQRYAAATMYFATGGEFYWNDQLNFLSGDHECSWNNPDTSKGIFCNTIDEESGATPSFTTITSMSLPYNNLAGSVPEEIGLLSSLTNLHIPYNQVGGSLPSSLASLRNLTYIHLQNNYLSGTLPEDISQFQKVLFFDLTNNYLTGTIPESMTDLSSIQELHVTDNILTGPLPDVKPGFFPYLQILKLDKNWLTGTIPLSFGNMTSLEQIFLGQNELNGTVPRSVGDLESLLVMDLSFNLFTGSLPIELNNLSALLILYIPGNKFTGALPFVEGALPSLLDFYAQSNYFQGSLDPVVYLTRLEYISLGIGGPSGWGNNFTGTVPSTLCRLTNLQNLLVGSQFPGLTGSIPDCIGNLTQMNDLGLEENNMEGTVPSTIGKLSNLQSLRLQQNNFQGSLPTQIGLLSSLRILFVTENNFQGSLPTQIGLLSSLRTLYASENNLSGDLNSLTSLSNLEIFLADSNNFNGTIPEGLGELSSLTSINLFENQLRGTLPKSFENLASLEYLSLARNNLFGDFSFMCDDQIDDSIIIEIHADCLNDTRSIPGEVIPSEVICPCCSICCSVNDQCEI